LANRFLTAGNDHNISVRLDSDIKDIPETLKNTIPTLSVQSTPLPIDLSQLPLISSREHKDRRVCQSLISAITEGGDLQESLKKANQMWMIIKEKLVVEQRNFASLESYAYFAMTQGGE
jgi:ABC-type cobalamin transport system ATPase subunit